MTTSAQNGFTRIAVEVQPPAARIVLKNPPLNVIDVAMMEELRAALEQIEARAGDQRYCFCQARSGLFPGASTSRHTRPTKFGRC